MSSQIKSEPYRVVIVGGGTAGWMTAAALSNTFTANNVHITLIESEQIGTIGVGEATIPQFIGFNKILGINENEFIKHTQGTYKLGIEFIDWQKIGKAYMHPFGDYGAQLDALPFYHIWQKYHLDGGKLDLNDFSICTLAAKSHKFLPPSNNKNSPLGQLNYAYHIDASKYAMLLRHYSEQREVTRIEGKVEHIQQHQTDYIESVTLEDGRRISGDLFIDCSGLRGLLINQTMKVPFNDWQHLLPCDSALTVQTESQSAPIPYTQATAKSAGWQWRIPLQHRVGNGYVYSSKFQTDEQARIILLSGIEGRQLTDVKQIHFQTGMREKFWVKNCIAIGLSSGFLEPLESTSIHLIQSSIARLISLFPTHELNDADINKYNQLLTDEFLSVRDFLVLHYHATERTDSAFWQYCKTMEIPPTLKHKLQLYQNAGRIFRDNNELFTEGSWLAVMHGQGIKAKNAHPVANKWPTAVIEKQLNKIHAVTNKTVEQMPSHESYLKSLN